MPEKPMNTSSTSLDVLRRAAEMIVPQTQNERILSSLIKQQERIINELQERVDEAEKQLGSKAHALSILQKARKNQEEHLVRQVSVIESLETELKRAVSEKASTPSKSPRVITPEGQYRRRNVRNNLFSEHLGRCDRSSGLEQQVVQTRRGTIGRPA